MVSDQLVSMAESMLADHVEYLERHGYTSCQSYVDGVWPEFEPVALKEADVQLAFEDCFRCYPADSPTVLWAHTNPGTPAGGVSEALTDRELSERVSQTSSMEDQITLTGKYGLEYLGKGERSKIVEQLQNNHPKLPGTDQTSTEEYLQQDKIMDETGSVKPMPEHSIDPSFGFFSDVYYTNVFKMFTDKRSSIPGTAEDEFDTHLQREIRVVDPDLVLCSGQQSWRALRSAVENAEDHTIDDIELLNGHVDDWDRFGSTNKEPNDGSVPANAYRFPDIESLGGPRDVVVTWHASRGGPLYETLGANIRKITS